MQYLVVSKYTKGNFTKIEQTEPGVQLIGFERRSPELKSLFIRAYSQILWIASGTLLLLNTDGKR